MARRDDDETCGTATMFDIEPLTVMKDENARAKRPRSVKFAQCPDCHRPTQTGLVRSGKHLVWRQHNLVTWSERRRPCISSGVAICVRPMTVKPFIECPCGAHVSVPGAA